MPSDAPATNCLGGEPAGSSPDVEVDSSLEVKACHKRKANFFGKQEEFEQWRQILPENDDHPRQSLPCRQYILRKKTLVCTAYRVLIQI